jgi:hypothetical protein
MGITSFVTPQVAYVRTVGASEDKFLGLISKIFDSDSRTDILKLFHGNDGSDNKPKSDDLMILFELTKHDDWVYPLHQTYTVVGFYLMSIIGSILGWKKIANFLNLGA